MPGKVFTVGKMWCFHIDLVENSSLLGYDILYVGYTAADMLKELVSYIIQVQEAQKEFVIG
jgi:hypothetical protein